MKSIIILSGLLIPILFQAGYSQTGCAIFPGVHEYELPDLEGICLYTEKQVVWVLTPKEKPAFEGGVPSEAEQAASFEGLLTGAGSWTCEGTRATITYAYAKDPALIGTSFDFEFETDGGTVSFRALDAEGNTTIAGKTHKLEGPGTPSGNNCQALPGAWKYELPDNEGMTLATENYYIWLLLDKAYKTEGANLNTMAGQARGFQAVNAAAGKYSCDEGFRTNWEVLISSDPRMVGQNVTSDTERRGGSVHYWFLDQDGNRIEPPGKVVRFN